MRRAVHEHDMINVMYPTQTQYITDRRDMLQINTMCYRSAPY